jgi:hypothetical protein
MEATHPREDKEDGEDTVLMHPHFHLALAVMALRSVIAIMALVGVDLGMMSLEGCVGEDGDGGWDGVGMGAGERGYWRDTTISADVSMVEDWMDGVVLTPTPTPPLLLLPLPLQLQALLLHQKNESHNFRPKRKNKKEMK